MDRGSSFGRAARKLRDFDVVLYDRRGYARSHHLEVSDDVEVQVADAISACADRPSVLIGHSLGGVLALAAAEARPDLVSAVGSYEAPLRWKDWWPRPTLRPELEPGEVAESFMRRVAGEELWLSLPTKTRDQRRREGIALLADLAAVEKSPFDSDVIECPVLVGVGAETDSHFLRAAEELVAELPRGELHVIPGADHGAHMSQPDAFAHFVRLAASRARNGHGYSDADE